jgi:hypothetical protein
MSVEVMSSRIPPATFRALMEIPKSLKTKPPKSVKKVIRQKAISVARFAVFRRFSGLSLAVMAMKIGSRPRGSMMKNTAGNVTRAKLRYSFTGDSIALA